ncbi:MAG: HAMP domain-containing histidine kinase [Planctomycetes bacterium]|nr:HAMP domain-containing histidine kinase [Planctomycetota bacterium]MBI3843865.1 HAMP domain-containing histidine kinase [Planctomycetota bacterium]
MLVVITLLLVAGIWQMISGMRDGRQSVLRSMRDEIEAIARTTALGIDAESHERIRGFGAADMLEFRRLREYLRATRRVNDLSTETFTLRPCSSNDEMQFVVMTNETPFVGSTCPLRPEMTRGLAERRATSTEPYSNARGSWISAYAPVIDPAGNAVALVEIDRTVDEFAERLRRRSWGVGAFAVVGLLVALALCGGLWAWLVRPLRFLAADLHRLAAGDLSIPLARPVGADEVSRLGSAFRHLVEELRRTRATVEAQRRRLERRNRRLRSANRAKERFLAMMSHDMRTPLNGTIGFLDLTIQGYARTPAEERQFLMNARESAIRMLRLVEAVLDLSQIEKGTLTVSSVQTDLTAILLAELRSALPLARSKGLRLSLDLPATPFPAVLADPVRLKQVVSVLLDNALKFTEWGGVTIRAAVLPGDETARVWVRDTGEGIPRGWEERVFDKFTQFDEKRNRKHGGMGLGLALARGLIQAMGGKIEVVASDEPGTLIQFDLALVPTLPVRRPTPRFTARGEDSIPAGA